MPYTKEAAARRAELVAEGEMSGCKTAVYLTKLSLGGESMGSSLSAYIIDDEGMHHLMGSALGWNRTELVEQAQQMANDPEAKGIYDAAFPEEFRQLCKKKRDDDD